MQEESDGETEEALLEEERQVEEEDNGEVEAVEKNKRAVEAVEEGGNGEVEEVGEVNRTQRVAPPVLQNEAIDRGYRCAPETPAASFALPPVTLSFIRGLLYVHQLAALFSFSVVRCFVFLRN